MALTKWGFLWGGPVPDPTFWGGNLSVDPPATPPFEVALNTSRIATSSLWMARDDPAFGIENHIHIIAGAVMGYVAGASNLPKFHPPGDFTCVVTRTFPMGPFEQSVRIIRSSEGRFLELSNDSTEAIDQMHATIRPSDSVVGAGSTPGFVGLVDTGSEFETWFYAISKIDGINPVVPFKATVWGNELSVPMDQIRVVDILRTNHGPLLVIAHDGEFYLKSSWGTGPGTAASKLAVDLSFDDWDPDLSRFHVIVTNNDILVIYYAVTKDGNNSTAVLAYRPFHGNTDSDLPFDASGVIVQPKLIWEGLVPTVSHTGAMRHQVSSDILVALQDTNDVNQVEKPNIHWLTTRGLGTVFDPVPDVWDEDTHPNLFGGKTESAAPDLAIDIISIGWSGNRQESLFFAIGSLVYEDTSDSYPEYENTYATGSQPTARATQRLCLGQLWVVTEGETNAGGRHSLDLVRSVAFRTDKQDRQGYDLGAQIAGDDLFDVKSLLSMTLVSGNQVPALKGPDASTGGSSVFPITGMVKNGGLNFPIPSSQVVIPGSSSFRGESVCLSLWVYPTSSGSGTNTSIAYMEGDGGTHAFWLRFDEVTQEFIWSVTVTGTGQIDINSAVPSYIYSYDRWYHVTALYNHLLEITQLYIFGVLIAEAPAGNGDVLDQHPNDNNPIILGEISPSFKSLFCRMDNFAVGFDSVKSQQVVAAFFHGLNSPEGPVRTNRFNDPTTQDFVFATASITRANGTVYTVAARQINPSVEEIYRYQIVFDVWRLDRGIGQDPQYMGVVAPPSEVMDLFNDDIDTERYMQSAWAVNDEMMFEITLLEEYDDSVALTGNLVLYAPFNSAESASPGGRKTTIWRMIFDPDAPLLGSSSGVNHEIVTVLPTSWTFRGMTAVSRKKTFSGSHSEAVFVSALDAQDPPDQWLYVLETDIFGVSSWASATPYHMEAITPPADVSGSFFSYAYNTAFATSGTVGIRGMAGRVVETGQGWPADRLGGVDLIIGLASSARGSLISAQTPLDTIVGTVIFHIPDGKIGPTTGGTEESPADEFRSRQWDEYGAGGIPPIVPLSWVQNPYSPTGDSFLLGRIGPRDAFRPGREGNSGLCIFKVKREGNWGVRPVVMVGPDWASEVSQTVGASLVWSTPPRTGEPAEGFEDLLMVTRPAVDRSDRYSTMYMDRDEAIAAGYVNAPPGAVGTHPYLRRSDRNAGVVWTGHRVETRGYTERPTGMTPKTNATHRVLMTLRWSLPGNAWDRTFP